MEFANELDVETAGDDAEEIWVMGTEFFPYEDMGVSYNDMEGKEPVSAPYHYSEWDYQIQLEHPDWRRYRKNAPKWATCNVDDIANQYKREIARMKFCSCDAA